jgi:hypothetical protein
MLGHIEIKMFRAITNYLLYMVKGFQWRYIISACNAYFDCEDPNLMIGMFLVSALRSSQIIQESYCLLIVLFALCCSLTYNINVLSVALSHFLSFLSII